MGEQAPRRQLPVESRLPAFTGARSWLNSAPLTPNGLAGNVSSTRSGSISSYGRAAPHREIPYAVRD